MRILQIRLKNLNSLVGQWEIDLTHPAFASDGIFAITGPTGAGKTSVLDAVCLALYGRTPRLSKITRSVNELMSRQTGDCFAEVTFETLAGRYRCHWSQHRARRKPDGELQMPKHEIADADSGDIFETKIRGVADQIEAATGMDFDRFTRSMLLAQGGFAAFLQAAPDDRAPILEQITGTEIYSHISIIVHERRSRERKKLEALQAELAGIRLLTSEDEQQLSQNLVQKQQSDLTLNQQISQINRGIVWIDGIARLEAELDDLARQQVDLHARVKDFASDQERLRRATLALELDGDYALLAEVRRQQETERQALDEYRKSLPGHEAAAIRAQDAVKAATDALEAKKSLQQQTLPVVRKARELDVKIAEREPPIQMAARTVAEVSASLTGLRLKQNNDADELALSRRTQADLRQQLALSRADGGLVEHMMGFEERFDRLLHLHRLLAGKLDEIKTADGQCRESLRTWQDHSAHLDKEKRILEEAQAVLAAKQAESEKVLDNRDLADWRMQHARLTVQKDLLARAADDVRNVVASRQTLADLDRRNTDLSRQLADLAVRHQGLVNQQAVFEKEAELLETQLTLLNTIKDYESERHRLQDGKPCPLCGALAHPFAAGNVPLPGATRKRLEALRTELKIGRHAVSQAMVTSARLEKDLETVAAGQKEHADRIDQARQSIAKVCLALPADMGLEAHAPDLERKLEACDLENRQSLEQTTRTMERADDLAKALTAAHRSLEAARETVQRAEREVQAALYKKDAAIQAQEQLKKAADEYQAQQAQSLEKLLTDLHPFGVEHLSVGQLDDVRAQLISRRDQWTARQRQITELDQRVAALDLQVRHQAEQARTMENEVVKIRSRMEGQQKERDQYTLERQAIFGDRDPEKEETRLSADVASADRQLETARENWAGADRRLRQVASKIEELVRTMGIREIQLTKSEAAFLKRLNASGFSDEQDYRSAGLSEGVRMHLGEQSRRLADEKADLAARLGDKGRLLEVERRKHVTDEPPETLKATLAGLVNTQIELHQEVGAIRQKLRENEGLKQQHQDRARAVEAQKSECSRWDLLHELIGSADGKKYRNFAQGLTFEMMIGHANRQLRKMSDRYLLIRDEVLPLELNVIDNYQAGEIRSTKNLSGGEGFIVSLSLALGLSHMASRNVRVDSLFLDEGFGTLDEEALDTALESLANLRQEGKLIGVISHVPAIKERIGTQIRVTPQTGGRSVISGPGCTRCREA